MNKWYTNTYKGTDWRNKTWTQDKSLCEGPPQATKECSVQKLEGYGMIGLYYVDEPDPPKSKPKSKSLSGKVLQDDLFRNIFG